MILEKNYLDKKFWKNFIHENDNFRTTCTIEDAFSNEDLETLLQGVEDTLYKRISEQILKEGFRVWVERNQLGDDYVKNLFAQNPPLPNEPIIDYCKRIFNKRFGIIMNNNECYSELLASRVAQMVEPLCELIGLPPLGYEITVFIGNYGWTPLGIHKDHVGENVLHFHLGPGRKQMYIWDDTTYEKLVGKDVYNNENIEPILANAKEFDFGKGDLYYMPWFENHVGYTDEISIGVTLWFRSCDNSKYSKKILSNFSSQFLPKDNRMIPPQIDYINNNDTLENFKENIFNYLDNKEISLSDFLESIYFDYKYSLLSNGGWSKAPLENNIVDIDLNELNNKKIKGIDPFKILYKESNKTKLFIFVRGNRIRVKYFEELISLIDKINSYEEFEVKDIMSNSNLPKDAYLYFISILYKYKGVQFIE